MRNEFVGYGSSFRSCQPWLDSYGVSTKSCRPGGYMVTARPRFHCLAETVPRFDSESSSALQLRKTSYVFRTDFPSTLS
jgi:hypothetical protein